MEELISVIIPVYNIEAYIERCLLSVIKQTYVKLQIIIVDDGSSDGSSMICKSFAEKDSRIVYIRQDNKGLVCARKTGLINANGKYIVFVDGDDYIETCMIEKLYWYMHKYNVDFVHSGYMIDETNINFIRKYHYYAGSDLTVDVRENILKNYVFEWDSQNEIIGCNIWGCIYKKEFIVECYSKIPDYQQFGEDLICMCHRIMKCKSMIIIPEAYYHYVMREGSLVHNTNFEHSIFDEISMYRELDKALRTYNVANVILERCHDFSVRRMIYCFGKCDDVNVETEYSFEYLEKLFGKKVVIYGAGNVGKSMYKQLTNYESIQIVAWVDTNYKEIHSAYRNVCAPDIIQSLDYDYIVIAIENSNIAEKIKEKLIESNVEKNAVLWKPYKKFITVTL